MDTLGEGCSMPKENRKKTKISVEKVVEQGEILGTVGGNVNLYRQY